MLTELPPDIVEEILVRCDPIEVAKAAQTCSALRALIYGSQDSKLWRGLYLAQPLDDLRKCVSQSGQPAQINWKRNLQRLCRARNVVGNPSLLKPGGELEEVLQTLLEMILYHRPSTLIDHSGTSLNFLWLSDVLQHNFINRIEEDMESLTFTERQLISRLHCYYGVTQKDVVERQARVNSRAYVYRIQNYRPETQYGPLLPGGAVNWEHMQALHHVVSMHLIGMREAGPEFILSPMGLLDMQVVIPVVSDGEEVKENEDWVGLEGLWVASFCHCDYTVLLGRVSAFL